MQKAYSPFELTKPGGMMDWKPYWLGIGAEKLRLNWHVNGIVVGIEEDDKAVHIDWRDPHDPAVPLEVIIDGWRSVAGLEMRDVEVITLWCGWCELTAEELRDELIVATCRLLGIKASLKET